MSAIAAIGSVNLTKPILVTLINLVRSLKQLGVFFPHIKKDFLWALCQKDRRSKINSNDLQYISFGQPG